MAATKVKLWLKCNCIKIDNDCFHVLWNGVDGNDAVTSLVDYVEINADRLRAKYLSFIHDLGKYNYKNKSLIEHLHLPCGHNLWWMSSLAEKSHLNSNQLTDCIKLLALEELLIKLSATHVEIVDGDEVVYSAVAMLCSNLRLAYTHEKTDNKDRNKSIYHRIYRKRPEFISALWWFTKYVRHYWLPQIKVRKNWYSGEKAITFFSYFYNLDEEKARSGEFYSRQWEILPDIIDESGIESNWFHHFKKGPLSRNCKEAISNISKFNKNNIAKKNHVLFESYLSLLIICRVLKKYLALLLPRNHLSYIPIAFSVKDSSVNFWHLHKREWLSSIKGAVALRNLIFIELVEAALSALPKQKLGLYLQENQYWERALIKSWRRYGHGVIIGVPHATVNYWDLRYYEDIRVLTAEDSYQQPRPDYVALNGPAAKKNFLQSNYPASEIIDVEALRYLKLKDKDKRALQQQDSLKNGDKISVIILGELKREFTLEMIRSVKLAFEDDANYCFTLKPHPACPITPTETEIPELIVTNEQLSEILRDYDLAIISGSTSAALDAYYHGISLIVYLGIEELNLSPLRDVNSVQFARSSVDIKKALLNIQEKDNATAANDFFWLDKNMPMWKRLVKIENRENPKVQVT